MKNIGFGFTIAYLPSMSPCGVVVQPMHHQHQLHASKLRAHTSIRNALNLDRHTLGQLLNRNTAARRLVREVLLVHAVHLSKVGHVVKEDVDLET
jgi:hypothetical protein